MYIGDRWISMGQITYVDSGGVHVQTFQGKYRSTIRLNNSLDFPQNSCRPPVIMYYVDRYRMDGCIR